MHIDENMFRKFVALRTVISPNWTNISLGMLQITKWWFHFVAYQAVLCPVAAS